MRQLIKFLLLGFAALAIPQSIPARDLVAVKWTPKVREYCHVLRFPQGWQMPLFARGKYGDQELIPRFELGDSDYEFRIPGVLGTRFLVRSVEDYGFVKYYTTNLYAVYLFDPTAVPQPADEEEWNSATVVPLRYKGPADALAKYIQSRGIHLTPGGDHGGVDRLSPDRAVLVLQSWSGTLGRDGGSDLPGDFSISLPFNRAHGKLFFDVYDADTGKKLVTITTSFVNIFPENIFEKTGWVTERYFFVLLDEKREKCLVCDFGRSR
jgi:hypothetical protein